MKVNDILKTANAVLFFTFLVHAVFAWIRMTFFIDNSDVNFYWNRFSTSLQWIEWQPYPVGNSFMLYLNYPFFKLLGLPVSFGFVMYGLISFFGYYLLYKWWNSFYIGRAKYLVLLILFLIPSLHFWNNGVAKEALLFPAFTFLFHSLYKNKLTTVPFAISVLIVLLIRPHFAFILLVSTLIYYLIYYFKFNLKSLKYLSLIFLIGLVSLYLFKHASLMPEFSFENIKLILKANQETFKETPSYVPLETYYYPYKIFTFFFRPFIGEIPGLNGLASGLENTFFLITVFTAFIIKALNYKKIKFPKVFYFMIIFSLVYASVFVLAYSNFGLISRTKALITPFIWMISLYTIGMYVSYRLEKK